MISAPFLFATRNTNNAMRKYEDTLLVEDTPLLHYLPLIHNLHISIATFALFKLLCVYNYNNDSLILYSKRLMTSIIHPAPENILFARFVVFLLLILQFPVALTPKLYGGAIFYAIHIAKHVVITMFQVHPRTIHNFANINLIILFRKNA
jgi:hypothetical protein